MSIKESVFRVLTRNASQKIHIEYAISNSTNEDPSFTWIKEDIDEVLERWGFTFEEYAQWMKENNKIDINIIFKSN
jgi:hypothetical protein